MDPTQLLTPEAIGERYFLSLNDVDQELHLVTLEKKAPGNIDHETIEKDVGTWYAGFKACIGMLPTLTSNQTANLTNRLPPVGSVTAFVIKNFATKAKIAA